MQVAACPRSGGAENVTAARNEPERARTDAGVLPNSRPPQQSGTVADATQESLKLWSAAATPTPGQTRAKRKR